ncbi:hypothetical protein P5E86_15210, partial [Clostridium perfringens]|nr:hypothetical protein [Clostridium perfringens]
VACHDFDRLLYRFRTAVDAALTHGHRVMNGVHEAHNELCVASALLAATSVERAEVHYEPPLLKTRRTIDFRVNYECGKVVYIDVKTISPRPED